MVACRPQAQPGGGKPGPDSRMAGRPLGSRAERPEARGTVVKSPPIAGGSRRGNLEGDFTAHVAAPRTNGHGAVFPPPYLLRTADNYPPSTTTCSSVGCGYFEMLAEDVLAPLAAGLQGMRIASV